MQSWQTCALSGELIETPVISKVSGHIFEKRLIEKHIESTGTCPITGRPLNFDDLIEVKVSRVQKPRPVTATSIPSLLSLLQNEWDALLLEQFQLKQHLESVRHELTHALYQHDAACRVIAKLIKERDQARIELSQLQHKLNQKVEVEANNVPEKLSANVIAEIETTSIKLTGQRKVQRKQQAYFDQFPAPEILSNYSVKQQFSNQQSITTLDVLDNYCVVGGQSGEVTLYSHEKLLFQAQQHQQPITSVKFFQIDQYLRFVSSSSDGSLITYQYNVDSNEGSVTSTIKVGSEITAIAIHPIQYLAIVVTKDGLLAFYNLKNGQQESKVTDFEGQCSFTSVAIHPDGLLLAIGQQDSLIKIWRITQGQLLAQFEGQEGAVVNLTFSENGTDLASTSQFEVNLWNLRKPGEFQKLHQGDIGTINIYVGGIAYDWSGQYLAVGSGSQFHLFDVKKQKELFKIASHKETVSAIGFGNLNTAIFSCSKDGVVNIYEN